MEQKKCFSCKNIQPLDMFTKNKSRLSGINDECKTCNKVYREQHRYKMKQYNKEYREEDKEKISKQRKEYRDTNREIISERKKNHYLKHYKNNRVKGWKKQGIICNDFDKVYNLYTNSTNCYLCNISFENSFGNSKKCLDHDHLSGYPRFVCCGGCNGKLKTIDNQRKDVLLELHRHFNTI